VVGGEEGHKQRYVSWWKYTVLDVDIEQILGSAWRWSLEG
jgi:hypothetical protein